MMLTTGLSRPFRQLERLAGAIQEVQQHLEDDHMDRGDTQRSIGFYKESAAEAARASLWLTGAVLRGPCYLCRRTQAAS